jgi:hypothetical protein
MTSNKKWTVFSNAEMVRGMGMKLTHFLQWSFDDFAALFPEKNIISNCTSKMLQNLNAGISHPMTYQLQIYKKT